MKILLDTNIVIDLLMDRTPLSEYAAEIFSMVEDGGAIGYLCATTVTTIYYLAAKTIGTAKAGEEIVKLLQLFEVAPVNRHVLETALAAGFSDFEDAVIHEAACHVGADALVTRNKKDYGKSRIPVYTAEEMAKILASI